MCFWHLSHLIEEENFDFFWAPVVLPFVMSKRGKPKRTNRENEEHRVYLKSHPVIGFNVISLFRVFGWPCHYLINSSWWGNHSWQFSGRDYELLIFTLCNYKHITFFFFLFLFLFFHFNIFCISIILKISKSSFFILLFIFHFILIFNFYFNSMQFFLLFIFLCYIYFFQLA